MTTTADKAALDALETDLLDVLNAVQRARRQLEVAQACEEASATVRSAPAVAVLGRWREWVPAGVRYQIKPAAVAVIEAALTGRRSVRG